MTGEIRNKTTLIFTQTEHQHSEDWINKMTEEQRKAALEALNVMEANEYWRRGDFSENIATIREALQAPPVPVIEGLEEAIERGSNPQMTGNEALDLFERGDFAKIIKAAHAYAEVQKGEQNGHDQS